MTPTEKFHHDYEGKIVRELPKEPQAMQEMSLEEYVMALPKGHRARKEYEELLMLSHRC